MSPARKQLPSSAKWNSKSALPSERNLPKWTSAPFIPKLRKTAPLPGKSFPTNNCFLGKNRQQDACLFTMCSANWLSNDRAPTVTPEPSREDRAPGEQKPQLRTARSSASISRTLFAGLCRRLPVPAHAVSVFSSAALPRLLRCCGWKYVSIRTKRVGLSSFNETQRRSKICLVLVVCGC